VSILPRKGIMEVQVVIPEDKKAATKAKILNALTTLRDNQEIESAAWKLHDEEIPESGTI